MSSRLVKASNAPATTPTPDFTCDGVADEVQINQAIAAVKAEGGGIVELSVGTFFLGASIAISGNNNVDDPDPITLRGGGSFATVIDAGTNIDGIAISNAAEVHISDLGIVIDGTGDGISASAAATTSNRSFWNSSFTNLRINGGFTATNTGWAMNLDSPFRSTFTNIEVEGGGNGFKLFSSSNAQNPGDCTFTRCFVELVGNNKVAYHINSPTTSGLMNQIVFVMCEAIADGTGCTGILIDGTAGTSWCRFIGTNLEQFDTLVHVATGEGNEFDLNYIEARQASGTTVFKCGTGATNNIFRAKFVYSNAAQVLINDANTNPNAPNIFENIRLEADASANVTATLAASSVVRDISHGGSGGTVAKSLISPPVSPNGVSHRVRRSDGTWPVRPTSSTLDIAVETLPAASAPTDMLEGDIYIGPGGLA